MAHVRCRLVGGAQEDETGLMEALKDPDVDAGLGDISNKLTATELRYQLNRLNANLEERRAELRAHRAQILGQIDNIMAHISDKSHPIHTAPLHSIRPIAPSGALRALSRVAQNGCPEIGLPCVAVAADAENEAPPAPRPLVSVSSALPK